MGRQPTRGQVAGALTALAVVLGGGGGTAGYFLHEAKMPEAFPVDRLVALEQWRATRTAIDERDLAERARLTAAVESSVAINASLKEAVVALTERLGYTRETVSGLETRVRALEATRPASYRRP